MDFILYLPVLIFSVIAHEYAHGYCALRCGDDTAYIMGRLNFNPLKHADLTGTLIVPLVLYMLNAPMFGWAKPVPVNYYRLQGGRRDMALVAFAGPFTNLALMFIAAVLLKVCFIAGFALPVLIKLLFYTVMINLVLAVFNLIPVPPLDGSKIISFFMPPAMAAKYLRLERYGFFILLILILSGGLNYVVTPVFNVIFALVFKFIGVPYGQF